MRPSASNSMHFRVREGSIPSWSQTASIVTAPGVTTRSNGSGSTPSSGRRGRGGGGLEIREVVAVFASHEQVLSHVGERHELVVHVAADRAGVGLDHHVIEPASVEDAFVRLEHHAVGLPHAVLIAIERVRVLHQELPSTQESVPRAELVAVLPLHLVEVDGKVPVRGELVGHERREHLFLGRSEHELAAVAIGEAEHLVAVGLPPPGQLPGLGGQHDRHAHLLRTRGVHLLADDRLDLLRHAHAEGHRGVHARHQLAHEGSAQQQSVAGGLGLGRVLPERACEELRQAA